MIYISYYIFFIPAVSKPLTGAFNMLLIVDDDELDNRSAENVLLN